MSGTKACLRRQAPTPNLFSHHLVDDLSATGDENNASGEWLGKKWAVVRDA